MEEIYSEKFWRLFGDLDSTLHPVGPEQLYELAAGYFTPGDRVLDVGCRDASHLIELVRRFGVTGTGVDPVAWHTDRARAAVAEAGMRDRISIRIGVAEELVEEADSYDAVWCRDVIEVLPDLATALNEMRRILRPAGHLIAYTNILNGPVDLVENTIIHEPLGNVVANLVESDLEAALAAARFKLVAKHVIGTQWREHLEERNQVVSRDLLRLARLRRTQTQVIERYGRDAFNVAEASLQWSVQQFLGRFIPVIYVLRAGS